VSTPEKLRESRGRLRAKEPFPKERPRKKKTIEDALHDIKRGSFRAESSSTRMRVEE